MEGKDLSPGPPGAAGPPAGDSNECVTPPRAHLTLLSAHQPGICQGVSYLQGSPKALEN